MGSRLILLVKVLPPQTQQEGKKVFQSNASRSFSSRSGGGGRGVSLWAGERSDAGEEGVPTWLVTG